jgi:hypothetical protein
MFKAKEVTVIAGQAVFQRLAKAEAMYNLSP